MGLLADTRTLQPTLVGGCRLHQVILDRPGFPTLYDAVRVETGEKASVRLYEIEANRRVVRRFMRAVERRAALEHPHLLEIHGAGVWEGRLVLAMGAQDMPSLGYRLQAGPLTPGEMLEVMGEVAAAIDFAADAGVLTREMGVGSILLDPARGVQLGDLGLWVPFIRDLAPWQHPYPSHISPEAARGEPLVRASNVYSLASLMFDCLTGAPPFEGHVVKVVEAHASAAPPRPSERDPGLDPALDRVFEIAMAKDPAGRYPTALEMVKAASDALSVAPVRKQRFAGPVAIEEPRPRKRGRLRRLAGFGVALVAVAALAAGGYVLGSDGEAEPAQAPAPVEPVRPAASAARDINAELRRVDQGLVAGRARLSAARTRRGQAQAAASLAREYRRSAGAIGAIAPASGLDPAGLSSRLGTAAAAHSALARAARSGDRRAYAVAIRRVNAAEAALRRDLANL
jgi:serine/threonine-protein kinase